MQSLLKTSSGPPAAHLVQRGGTQERAQFMGSTECSEHWVSTVACGQLCWSERIKEFIAQQPWESQSHKGKGEGEVFRRCGEWRAKSKASAHFRSFSLFVLINRETWSARLKGSEWQSSKQLVLVKGFKNNLSEHCPSQWGQRTVDSNQFCEIALQDLSYILAFSLIPFISSLSSFPSKGQKNLHGHFVAVYCLSCGTWRRDCCMQPSSTILGLANGI